MNYKIVLMKLITGDTIICKVGRKERDTFHITDTYTLVHNPIDGTIHFLPFPVGIKKGIDVLLKEDMIVATVSEDNIDSDVLNKYLEIVSNIVIPKK